MNITNKEPYLSALKTYDIECQSLGSRPEAVITWWKGTHQVKHMARNVSLTVYFRPLQIHNKCIGSTEHFKGELNIKLFIFPSKYSL